MLYDICSKSKGNGRLRQQLTTLPLLLEDQRSLETISSTNDEGVPALRSANADKTVLKLAALA